MRQRKGYFRKERRNEMGRHITELRITQGLTQEKVASRLGWSKSYICKIETSRTTPDPTILAGYARACGTRSEYLLAKVPQLEFNLLRAITAPSGLPADPLELLRGVLPEEERQELISYLAFLRLRRGAPAP